MSSPGWFDESFSADGWFDGSFAPSSGSPPPPVVVWSPGTINTEGHRFFSIDLKTATAGLSVTLQFTHTDGEDKIYTITSGASGVWTTRVIDLCQPDDMADDDDSLDDGVYTQESRYPLKSGSASQPDKSDATWGLNGFDTLTITGLEAGDEIDNLKLVVDSYALGTFMPSFRPFASGWTGTSQKPAWYSNTDGRVSDRPFFFLSGSTYSWHSITNALLEIAQASGWTLGSGGTLPADGYHGNGLEGFLLGGGGVSYNWSGGGSWVSWIDRSLTAATNIPAQALWDEIQGFPGIGEAWLGGSYGGPMKIRAAKVVRGHAWGLAKSDTSGEALEGIAVTLKTSPGGVFAGSGDADPLGHYSTRAPFGKKENHKVSVLSKESVAFMVYARTRHRRCLFPPTERGSVDYTVRADQTHFRVSIDGSGNVITGVADNTLVWDDTTQDWTADFVSIYAGRNGIVWMSYSDSVDIRIRSTADGVTWGVPTTVAAGASHSHPVALRDGRLFVYWIDGAAIKGRQYDPAGNLVGSTFTAVASGVDDVAFGADVSTLPGGSIRMSILCTVSGTLTHYTSSDGQSFS